MKAMIDRKRVRQAFHRQADEYNRNAVVQKKVVNRITELVIKQNPTLSMNSMLDIGCGTGTLLKTLAPLFPPANIVGIDLAFNMAVSTSGECSSRESVHVVNGDAGQLPFRSESFDLVVSASTLQWIDDLSGCLNECCRVLEHDGTLCLAFFGEGTLRELGDSYREALEVTGADRSLSGRTHPFVSEAKFRALATALPFSELSVFSETEREFYQDVPQLLAAIKGIGAGAVSTAGADKGLGWRRVISEMTRIYGQKHGQAGGIPATYRVIYLVARGYRGVTTT